MTCCGVIYASLPRCVVVGMQPSHTGLVSDLVNDLAPRGLHMSLTKAEEHFLDENWSPADEALPSKQA